MKQLPLFEGMAAENSCAAYVRVSSRSQSHAMQRAAIEKCAEARGDHVGRWFVETMSAARLARPMLDHVRELARTGALRTLYVYRLDRLARSGIRDTLGIVEELRGVGCKLVTVADGFDLEGPASDVVIAMLGWAAKMERLAIGERIAAARVRVEAKGGAWGRPRRVDATSLAKMKKLQAAGKTLREIAISTKVPRSTVADALSEKHAPKSSKPKPKKQASKKGSPPLSE